MENKHRNRILANFARDTEGKRIVVLDIPDEYRYMDSELVEEIESAVRALLP